MVTFKFKWAIAPLVGMAALAAFPAAMTSAETVTQTGSAGQPHILAQADFDIIDTAIQQGSLDTFVYLLESLGMAEDLRGYGRFTVFAPSDAAFESLDEDTMTLLLSDRDLLAQILAYHVIASGEPIFSDAIADTASYRSLERSDLELRRRGRQVYVNDVQIVEPDVETYNGVIHVVDQVLIPPDLLDRLP